MHPFKHTSRASTRSARRAAGIAALALTPIALAPRALQAQFQPTPTPTMEAGGACPAVVRYGWDVRSRLLLTGVTWEFKAGPFDVPDDPDPSRDAGEWVHDPLAEVTIDLRDHGPVLDGSAYRFRVIGGNLLDHDLAPPSEAVTFSESASPDGSFQALAAPGGVTIDLSWSLPPEIAGCADRIQWEVKRGGSFTVAEGPDPTAIERGAVDGTSGSTTIDLSAYGAGDYRVRVAAFHDGTDPEDAVGTWSSGVPVSIESDLHRLELTVVDEAAEGCGTAGTPIEATVTATGGGETYETATDPAGTAVLDLPEGEYSVTVSPVDGSCPPRSSDVSVVGDETHTIELADCSRPYDLAVSIDVQGEVDPGPNGLSIPVRLTNLGSAGPSPSALLVVDKRPSDGGGERLRVGNTSVGPLCPGETETEIVRDSDPPTGESWRYTARWTSSSEESVNVGVVVGDPDVMALDRNAGNDETSTTIAVGGPNGALPPIASPGQDPADPELHRLTITVEDLAASSCDPDATVAGAHVGVDGDEIDETYETGPDGRVELELPAGTYSLFPMSGACGEASSETIELTGDRDVAVGLPSCSRPYDLAVEIESTGPSRITSPAEIELPVRVDVLEGATNDDTNVLLQRRLDDSQSSEILEVHRLGARCAGSSERVLFRDAPPPGSWVYRAFVRQDLDPGNSDDTARITVRPPQAQVEIARPDLALDAVQNPDAIVAGEQVRYTIKVGNRGSARARGVVVEGVLSADLDHVSSDATNGFACNLVGRMVRCTRSELPAGEGTSIDIVAALPENTSSGRTIRFRARTTTETEETDEANNRARVSAVTESLSLERRALPGPLVDVFHYAEERGFSHGFIHRSGHRCGIANDEDINTTTLILLVDAGKRTPFPDTVCDFHLFTGQSLDDPWSFADVRVRYRQPGAKAGRCKVVSIGSDGSGIVIRGDVPGGRSEFKGSFAGDRRTYCEISRIEMIGPAGADWREAFE